MKYILILVIMASAISCKKNDSTGTIPPVKKNLMYRVVQHNKDGTVKISPVVR